MPQPPHVAAANGYARAVARGRVPACHWVRQACRRHLDDLKAARTKTFPYRFDAAAAETVCRFITLLPHTKGRWARQRETIALEPWQAFLTCAVFGWKRKRDGLRRFRRVLLLIPRKNGKSLLAAAWGLYLFCADEEFGAEVYSGATTEKQAWEVFRPARLMAQRTPALTAHYGIEITAESLHRLADGSRFQPIIGDPPDGASPSAAIHDEYHEHADDRQVDTMETGMGARDQPLQIVVTTAGSNLAGPCYQAQLDAQQMLDGVFDDPELFAAIWTIDKDDDWTAEAALRKANPNYGVSVSAEFLVNQQKEAVRAARKAAKFKTKHLNLWVASRSAFFPAQRWIEAAVPDLRLDEFAGQPCVLALDLASRIDMAAKVYLFDLTRCRTERADRLRAAGYSHASFGRYYLPEETVDAPGNGHYRGWADEGRIVQTDGQIIDFGEIKAEILEDTRRFQVETVAYDPFQATQLVTELAAESVPVLEYRQTVVNFSEPMKDVEGLMLARRIAHPGCPVTTWMIANVTAKEDAKDNVYPRKERAEDKIDGAVALIMARGVTLAAPEAPQRSFWEATA